jgi:hypothetical protein
MQPSRSRSTASPTRWNCRIQPAIRSGCMFRWMRSPRTSRRSACPRWHPAQCFQQNLAHLNVYSNVPGIVTGEDLAVGTLNSGPTIMLPATAGHVPNASEREIRLRRSDDRPRRRLRLDADPQPRCEADAVCLESLAGRRSCRSGHRQFDRNANPDWTGLSRPMRTVTPPSGCGCLCKMGEK